MSSVASLPMESAMIKDSAKKVLDPENMADVMKVLPKDALTVNHFTAWFTVFRVWMTVIISYYVLYYCPLYLLPLAWIFAGTAITGLFVIAHDCAHQSFSGSPAINEFVGSICMMPLVFPYNAWDLTHSRHHNHANNIDKDYLWKPLYVEDVEKMSLSKKYLSYYMYGPFFFESSIFHHAYHFIVPIVTSKKRIEVSRSILIAILGAYISISISLRLGGFIKFWLIPFFVFQFWLSTFTYFHHRLPSSYTKGKPSVGWKKTKDWSKIYGGLYATVHVDYPAWVEFLTLDINWHLPHHVSSRIPWYNLRRCTHALLKTYGDKMNTVQFNWDLWRETTTSTHMYDELKGYAPMKWNEKTASGLKN